MLVNLDAKLKNFSEKSLVQTWLHDQNAPSSCSPFSKTINFILITVSKFFSNFDSKIGFLDRPQLYIFLLLINHLMLLKN